MLTRRIHRYNRLLSIALADFSRALSWSVLGGKQFYHRHFEALRQAHRWCFIVGCNNSGTSLLQRILELSGEVSTLPYEGQRFTRVLERTGRRGHERVWMEYADELKAPRARLEAVAPRLIHDWTRDLPLPLRRTIVEKTPANVLRMSWLQEVFPNSCFIGLVRNGYAVSEGIHRKGKKSFARAARHWNAVNRFMLAESGHIREFRIFRYEDITEQPLASAESLAEFVGLDADRVVEAMKNDFSFETVRGNGPLRLKNLNSASIARLSDQDKQSILKEAGEMLTYFSYMPE